LSLGIEVEKKQVDPLLKELSFLGRVFSSSIAEIAGKFHSIKVEPNDILTVEKKGMTQRHLHLLTRLAEHEGPELLCLLIDDNSYLLAELSERGVRILDERGLPYGGKSEPQKYSEELRDLMAKARFAVEKAFEASPRDMWVMGPYVFVDEFLNRLKTDRPKLAKRVVKKGYASSATVAGLNEVLRGPLSSQAHFEPKPARDAKLVETLIERLSQGRRDVCLGREEVQSAAQIKAIKILLVEEGYLWKHIEDDSFIQLVDEVDKLQAETVVISGQASLFRRGSRHPQVPGL